MSIDDVDIEKLTPMMKQYAKIKMEYNDCFIFYRLGDFYELFFEDAEQASKILGLTLTARDCGLTNMRAPMCGVPFHACNSYITKLVEAGKKVAICEQLSEPVKNSKELVERGIIRVISAGTIVDSDNLEQNKNNFMASIFYSKGQFGMTWVDITTGEMITHSSMDKDEDLNFKRLNDILVRVKPSEIICNKEMLRVHKDLSAVQLGLLPEFHEYYEWAFDNAKGTKQIVKQLGITSINGLDINNYLLAVSSTGALLTYLDETQKKILQNITNIVVEKPDDYMYLDNTTRRNLELVENVREKKGRGTLLWVLDKTQSPMGARKLKSWIEQPLQDSTLINQRLDAVEEMVNSALIRENLYDLLGELRDIERMCGKVSYGSVSPRGLLDLAHSLDVIPAIKEILNKCSSQFIVDANNLCADFTEITNIITSAIVSEETPTHTRDGGYIKLGFNAELDKLLLAKTNANEYINNLTMQERELTGIKTLKIAFNNVFGYYIEVPKRESINIPISRYTRKQTLANAERYTTDELKEIESVVLNATENSIKMEQQIFEELKGLILHNIKNILLCCEQLAKVDCIISLALVALKQNFTRPIINKQIDKIKIVEGRHCVVEKVLNEQFIPNDTLLDNDENRIMIITGPNMAGKSTYMRQVATITLLAHIGSFVPAKSAEICIVDRIFTRIGASDDLSLGQSTFMVEMLEVSNILNNMTDKSLVILDEVGRGTSTYDGLSIAWSVVEYLSAMGKGKVLFATHFHELTELESKIKCVKNYQISIKELNNKLLFLRKIVRGGTDKSFGIEVGAMAGLPKMVIDRAKNLLCDLQLNDINFSDDVKDKQLIASNGITEDEKKVLDVLKNLNIERMSPMETFALMQDIIKTLK